MTKKRAEEMMYDLADRLTSNLMIELRLRDAFNINQEGMKVTISYGLEDRYQYEVLKYDHEEAVICFTFLQQEEEKDYKKPIKRVYSFDEKVAFPIRPLEVDDS
jgi:hypothetical protein